MSQTPISVNYSLEEILKQINSKLDKIDNKFETKLDAIDKKFETKFEKMEERLTSLEIGQTKLTQKVEGMDNRLQAVEGTQRNQVWALIVLLGSAIATAGFRTFFVGTP